MNKTIFSLIILVSVSTALSAATTYKILGKNTAFRHNTAVGTFLVRGVTYGHITGIHYTIEAVSDTGDRAWFEGEATPGAPFTSFPSTTTAASLIQTDATNRRARALLDTQLTDRAAQRQRAISPTEENIKLDGISLTLP